MIRARLRTFVHILGVPKPCCQLEILLEGVEKWVMHKICCLFSLVWLLKWKTTLNIFERAEGSFWVIRPRKSHYSRLFCALVQHVSLPYLAFSSNPALQLRHFLWALSTCSLYCAGIFYIWQEVGLSQMVCRSLFLIVWETDSIFSKVIFRLSLLLTCSKDNIRKHDLTWEDYETFLTRASKCHVVPCMFLTRCIVRECKLSSFWSTGEIKKEQS